MGATLAIASGVTRRTDAFMQLLGSATLARSIGDRYVWVLRFPFD
jgi:hypothetical protein